MSALREKLSLLDSANDDLTIADLDKFQAGRPKNEILSDLKWRGACTSAGDCAGKRIFVIDYSPVADGPERYQGDSVQAVFIDEKFEKFIKWLPGESENEGTPQQRLKPTKVGDNCGWLTRAINTEAGASKI